MMEENKKPYSVPNEVRWARLQAGISTQKELARLCGLHPSIISDLERGKRKMTPTWANKIAKVTGADVKDLMKGTESHGLRPNGKKE